MKVIDGGTTCANMAYNFSDISFIYPITPSSPMASQIDLLSNQNKKNIFDDNVKIIEMQSEAGAAGAMHGALLSGALATTYTSSQGLLLMLPNMYKMAGELLPAVIHVASRSIATHALSIFGDHQDIYAARTTGFAMLASTNVQDAHYLALVTHLSSIESSIPFIHFFDGFRTSHELNMVKEVTKKDVKSLVNFEKIKEFRERALNSGKAITKGTAQNEDIYFQVMESKNKFYDVVPDIVAKQMEKVNKITKTDYQPFNYYGSPTATKVIVAMGSVCDTIKEVVNYLNLNKPEYGVVEVHLYRPFSKKYLEKVLPTTTSKIAVLDRTKEHGSAGEPLYLDVLAALSDTDIKIYGGRYGLSSKNTVPSDINNIFMMLENEPKNNFTVGINDNVTNTNLKEYEYKPKKKYNEIKVYGFASDGMISACRDILTIFGENSFIQGYFIYDSKKSGGVTISNLRVSKDLIKAPYYVTNPELIVVAKDEYFTNLDMITNINENGTLLINTEKNEQEINEFLSNEIKEILLSKNIKVYTINGTLISEQNNIPGKISLIMEACILRLMDYTNYENILTQSIKNRFKTKGEHVINANLNCLKESKNALKEIKINNNKTKNIEEAKHIFELINNGQGDKLSVNDLIQYTDGTFPGGSTQNEKRKMSNKVSKWDKDTCIECSFCVILCPHAVIRSFLLNKGNKYSEHCKNAFEPDKDFMISISEADCTGCGICIKNCPKNCLSFGEFDEEKQKIADDLFQNHENPEIGSQTIRGFELKKPLFEFSGACAGCGETPYIKLLTQLVGEKLVIANATGCSSIYGGSCPSTPYKVSWANSLFEDNAEFGLGILESYYKFQTRIDKILQNKKENKVQEFYKKWQDNKNDYKYVKNLEIEAKEYLPEELIPYLTPKSVWTIGGDGWAYDIGFGGIDHILSSNKNAKILVLDTEVYSNTGGQASKSSKIGAVAEFANMGKRTRKKDLFRICTNYPNVFVAQVSLGANMMHTIKTFKEAEEHDGPAIIIAYSPCVEQGIKGGLTNSVDQQKRAVECGYLILMRYKNNQLYLDSGVPNFDKYYDYLDSEVRYSSLKIKDENLARKLYELNKESAIEKYEYYKHLVNK